MKYKNIILISTAQPDRPNGSMVRYGIMVREALEKYASEECVVEELNLSPTQAWLDHFPGSLQAPIRYLCIAINARRLLPKQRGAVLHLLDGSHAYLLDAVRVLSVPLVMTVHDLIPALCLRGDLKGARPGKGAGWVLQRAVANLKRANAIAAVSENTRLDVCRIAGVDLERTCVVHSSVGVPAKSTFSPKGPMYILHVAGNNNFYKNRSGVIEIFKEIHKVIPVRLKLAGAPPDAALMDQIHSSGVEEAIEFCTNVSEQELSDLYRRAAFLLFPSFYEGFGWPPLEAMAHGCPVICSDAGSLKEIAGDAAWTASPSDTDAFSEYGIRMLSDSAERQCRIEAGFAHVNHFSMEQMAAGLTGAYQQAREGHKW